MLLATPPFAPSVVRALNALGMLTRGDLRRTGAVQAFLLLKAAGCTVTRSVLWQLAAECAGTDVRALTEADKAALWEEVKRRPPAALPPDAAEAEGFMRQALRQAQTAAALGEVPVGAVVVRGGEVLAAAHNRCLADCDVSAHAEIRALSAAGWRLGSMRLDGCDVYVTLEPCAMCASALLQARVARVVFGAAEPKSGAAGSVCDLFADGRLNSHTAVFGGILADESRALLRAFFRERRQKGGV